MVQLCQHAAPHAPGDGMYSWIRTVAATGDHIDYGSADLVAEYQDKTGEYPPDASEEALIEILALSSRLADRAEVSSRCRYLLLEACAQAHHGPGPDWHKKAQEAIAETPVPDRCRCGAII